MSANTQGATATADVDGLRRRAERGLRRLAAISVAGALLGVLVGGVGGRLAMMLLARLNPEVAGIVSDDGFVMGRFTVVKTLNLLGVGLVLGLFGAAVYALLRGLMIGPRWFQVASISLGPAVVVGEMLVHTDGVDFRLLKPVALAIALFLLVPGMYAALVTLLAEQWLRADSWFLRGRLPYVVSTLLLWLVVFPLLPVLVALALLWLVHDAISQTRIGARALASPAGPWLARAALAALFLASGVRLVQEAQTLLQLE